MPEEKKSFRESRLYPIIFMIIVAAFFGLILSVFYHTTKDRVQRIAELRYRTALLSLFSLSIENVDETYDQYIEEFEVDGLIYYTASKGDEMLGYCFFISGTGLWGTITALVAVDDNLESIIGLHILEQNETPGLGGRITEDSFQDQFSGKKIVRDGEVVSYQLVGESEPATDVEVNQITGATASSRAVVDILYRSFREIAEKMEL